MSLAALMRFLKPRRREATAEIFVRTIDWRSIVIEDRAIRKLRENLMACTTPVVVEVRLGMEVTSYASAQS